MANLDQAIQFTQLFQDVELSYALQQLRDNPEALTKFLQNAQDRLYKDVISQKDETFQKVYGDLERASDTERSIYYYHQRNKDLNKLQEQVYNVQKSGANAVLHDRDLAKRQYEINQWSSGNKMDTLFIYSQLFIILCTVILLSFLWATSMLSTSVCLTILLILVLIFVFTIVNRAQYTQFLRDNRFWNRRKFPTYGAQLPNVCSNDFVGDIQKQYDQMKQSARTGLIGATTGLQAGIGVGATELAKGLQSFKESI